MKIVESGHPKQSTKIADLRPGDTFMRDEVDSARALYLFVKNEDTSNMSSWSIVDLKFNRLMRRSAFTLNTKVIRVISRVEALRPTDTDVDASEMFE